MVSTDRTREFVEILAFLGAGQRALPPAKPREGTPDAASLADFHLAASSLSSEITLTSQKANIETGAFYYLLSLKTNRTFSPLRICSACDYASALRANASQESWDAALHLTTSFTIACLL